MEHLQQVIMKPFKQITRKPLVPSDEETKRNPRARSAKMRVVEKAVENTVN